MIQITQSDIAKKLNVTRITVSKALRNHPDISPETKKKVLEASAELGYVPNLIAKNLTIKKTSTIGIVIPDLENSFFAYITDSIIDAASEKGYSVYVTVSREKNVNEILNLHNLLGMRVDGILACISQNTTDLKIFEQIKKIGIPLVFFDRRIMNLDFSSVVFDDKDTAEFVVDKIIAEGYTKIGHFAGYQTINVGKDRYLGYKIALLKNKLKVNEKWIVEGGFEVIDGVKSFMKLYNENNLPEVILAVNDRVAYGIYQAAKEVDLNIPEDIGVVAFGFKETAETFTPKLTVINQDPRKIGKLAMKILFEEIENTEIFEQQNIILEEEFLWNDSLKRLKR